jgi:hypothetical protein
MNRSGSKRVWGIGRKEQGRGVTRKKKNVGLVKRTVKVHTYALFQNEKERNT